jgi:hypothetical protein
MSEVQVFVPNLHAAQQKVEDEAGRFNVLRMGRRWGKSTFAIYLAENSMINGDPVGAFFPTFDFCEEFWEELKERLEPIIVYKSESKHIIKLITGGSIKIWSLEKSRAGRGKKYKRVIVDEAAFAKDLKESWEKAIRPTLTDLIGDAWILSTPNGRLNHFHTLDQNSDKYDNWKSFHTPSHTNPLLSKEELEEIRLQLDDLTWMQEFMAEYVDFTGRPFAYSFDVKKHVGNTGKPKISLPLDLSFDFNVDPITCIACQHSEDKDEIRIHKEFRLKDSDVYELCDAIIAEYGDEYYLRVTGDASGANRSAMVMDNLNYYKIIIKRLKLEPGQMFVPSSNPSHRNSRTLTNSLFKRHPSVLIDEEGCPFLILDNKFVECDENGDIDKTGDKHRGHLIDCERYYFNTWHSDFLKKYNENSN